MRILKFRIFLAFIYLVLSGTSVKAQVPKYFSYSDSILHVGAIKNMEYVYPQCMYPYISDYHLLTLDSIALFLKRNKNIILEIGVFENYQGRKKINEQHSQHQAEDLKERLVKKGIAENRIAAKGYGERFLKISKKEIVALRKAAERSEDLQDYQSALFLNERIELKILKH